MCCNMGSMPRRIAARLRHIACCCLPLLAAGACSDPQPEPPSGKDKESPDAGAPAPAPAPAVNAAEGQITFPAPRSRTRTDETRVAGCVSRAHEVSSAYLHGERLELDAQGCFRTRVRTPLGETRAELEVERNGSRKLAARVVLVHEYAPWPFFALAADPAGARVFVLDLHAGGRTALIELSLDSDAERMVAYDLPAAADLAYDPARKQLWMVLYGELYGVDVESGARSRRPWSGSAADALPISATALALDAATQTLFLLEGPHVRALDLDKMVMRTLHDADAQSASALEDLAYSAPLKTLYASRPSPPAILAYDARTGAEQVLVDGVSGRVAVVGDRLYVQGSESRVQSYRLPSGAPLGTHAVEPGLNELLTDGDQLLLAHQFGVFRMQSSGLTQRLRDFTFPQRGAAFDTRAGIALDEETPRVFVANGNSLLTLDLNTGQTRELAAAGIGQDDPVLHDLRFIDRDATTGQLTLRCASAPYILSEVDPESAARRRLADLTAMVGNNDVAAIATHARRAYVALADPPGLLRVELESGRVEQLPIDVVGHLDDIEVDPVHERLFVVAGLGDVDVYELSTWAKTARIPTSSNTNDGSAAYVASSDTLWIWDTNNGTGLVGVELASKSLVFKQSLFGGTLHSPLEPFRGHLAAFDGRALQLQDASAEQQVEIWRPR